MDQIRKPKILDMSIFDWVTALLGGFLIAYYLFDITDPLFIESTTSVVNNTTNSPEKNVETQNDTVESI